MTDYPVIGCLQGAIVPRATTSENREVTVMFGKKPEEAKSVFGNTTHFRDGMGNTRGSSIDFGGTTQFRDASGNLTGSSSNLGGITQYRDAMGNPVGSSNNLGGVTQYRDSSGNLTSSASSGSRPGTASNDGVKRRPWWPF